MVFYNKQINKNTKTLLILLTLSLIFLGIIFYKVFTNPFYYFSADNSELYFPWWVFISRSMRDGQFPFLNPYWFSGSLPFASIETNLFYPLYALISFISSFTINLNTLYYFFFTTGLLHYIIASFTFYFLAKNGLKLSSFASIFGSLIYAFSGSFIGRFTHIIVIYTFAWIPLLYLFHILFIQQPSIKKFIGIVLTLMMIITASHPQYTYYVFIFYTFASLSLPFFLRKYRIYLIMLSFLALLIACLLTSYKLLAFLELSKNIIRTAPQFTIYNLYNSLHPLYFLTLLAPYAFGKHQIGYWGSEYPWGNWENFLYMGIIPLLAIPFIILWKNKPLLYFFLLNTCITLILLFGKYNWLSTIINQNLPFSDKITMISKYSIFLHFYLAVLATAGIHVIQNLKLNKKIFFLFIAYVGFLTIFLFFLKNNFLQLLPEKKGPPNLDAYIYAQKNIIQSFYLILVSVLFISLPLMLHKKKLLYLLILIYAFDLSLSVAHFNPIEQSFGTPNQYFGSNRIFEKIKQDKSVYRVYGINPRNVNMIERIESTYGYHTVETISYETIKPLILPENKNILDLLNIKYLIAEDDLSAYPYLDKIDDALWINKTVLPRVTFIPNAIIQNNPEEIMSLVLDKIFDPRKTVIISTHMPAQNTTNILSNEVKVETKEYRNGYLKAQVDSPGGYLFFSQLQYPGWNASIDGKRTTLLPANLAFYAIKIPSGNHTVEFFYISRSIEIGFDISIVTFATLSIGYIFYMKKRSRNK